MACDAACAGPTVFHGVLAPPDGGSNISVALCAGHSPFAAITAACREQPAACSGRRSLLARDLLARTVMRANRASHALVERWLPPKENHRFGLQIAGSINYGVSTAEAEANIDRPIPFETSYSDVLAWLLLSFDGPTRYLEIGVSVGKTLHALTRTAITHYGARRRRASPTTESETDDPRRVTLVGLDLEKFNPRLARFYPARTDTCVRWPTPSHVDDGGGETLKADADSTLCEHEIVVAEKEEEVVAGDASSSPAANDASSPAKDAASSPAGNASPAVRLLYTSADLKSAASWDAVSIALRSWTARSDDDRRSDDEARDEARRMGFDLIFSDAWHAPSALVWELRQIVRHRLLSHRAVMVWDDLNTPSMREGFAHCCAELQRAHPASAVRAPAAVDAAEAPASAPDRIECIFSAVASGFVVGGGGSDLIGIAGPARVLAAAGLRDVLPSLLTLEDFGYTLGNEQ